MSDQSPRFREPLLVDELTDRLGFDAIGARVLGRDLYPPYLFLLVLIVWDFGIVNTAIHYTVGQHIFVATPTAVAAIPGLCLAVIGIRYMSKGYGEAIKRLRIPDRAPESDITVFEQMFSWRARLGIYLLGAILLTSYVLLNMSSAIVSVAGIPGLIHRLVMWNIYLIFVVEFGLLYIGLHVLLPRWLKAANIRLFYYDPQQMGGFGPVGQLLKRSYYLFTGGLLLFLVITYGPTVLDPARSTADLPATLTLFFTAAWALGISSIAHSMITIHRLMATQKEQHIAALEAELRDVITEPYEITTTEQAEEEQLSDIERRLEKVRATRVYPATFTMWSQIAISVLIPQALQLIIQSAG